MRSPSKRRGMRGKLGRSFQDIVPSWIQTDNTLFLLPGRPGVTLWDEKGKPLRVYVRLQLRRSRGFLPLSPTFVGQKKRSQKMELRRYLPNFDSLVKTTTGESLAIKTECQRVHNATVCT